MNSIFCSICSCCEDFNNCEKNVATGCGHIYHDSCLKRWLQLSNSLRCPDCRTVVKPSELRRVYLHFSKNSASDVTLLKKIIADKDKDNEAIKEKFKRCQEGVKTINSKMRDMKTRMIEIKQKLVQSLQQNEQQLLTLIVENAELKQQVESNKKIVRKINLRILKRSKKIENLKNKVRRLQHFRQCQVRKCDNQDREELVQENVITKQTRNKVYTYFL